MRGSRLIRWRTLKLQIAEAEHARALVREQAAQSALEDVSLQHQNVLGLRQSPESVDVALLRWLEPIEAATVEACTWYRLEVAARANEKCQAAHAGARERKHGELTRERVQRDVHAAERARELVELDAHAALAREVEDSST